MGYGMSLYGHDQDLLLAASLALINSDHTNGNPELRGASPARYDIGLNNYSHPGIGKIYDL